MKIKYLEYLDNKFVRETVIKSNLCYTIRKYISDMKYKYIEDIFSIGFTILDFNSEKRAINSNKPLK